MARIRISRGNFQTGVLSIRAQTNTDNEIYNWGLNLCNNFAIRKLGGAYKRSGTLFIKESNSLYSRLIEFNYSPNYSCILMLSIDHINNNLSIEIISNEFKDVLPPPVILDVFLTQNELTNLSYFVYEYQLWFYIPYGEHRNKDKCGFYYIYNTDGISFEISLSPIQFSVPPMVPIKFKRYLNVEFLNDNRLEANIKFIIPNTNSTDPNIINDDWVNRLIIFKYVNIPNDDEDTLSAGTYWFKYRVTNLVDENTLKIKAVRQDKMPNVNRIPEDVLYAVEEWMVEAFDTVINNDDDEENPYLSVSGYLGTPQAITYFKGRLHIVKNSNLFISKLGDDIFNFEYGSSANSAYTIKFSEGNIGKIEWLFPYSSLIIGTSSGIYVSDGIVISKGKSFVLEAPEKISSIGVNLVRPVYTSSSITFIGKDNVSIYELTFTGDSYQIDQINSQAEDLFDSGIKDLGFLNSSERMLFVVTNEGNLVCCVYSTSGVSRKWFTYLISGQNLRIISAESLSENGQDNIFLHLVREKKSKLNYFIEMVAPFFNPIFQNRDEQIFLDSSVIRDLPFPIKNINISMNIQYYILDTTVLTLKSIKDCLYCIDNLLYKVLIYSSLHGKYLYHAGLYATDVDFDENSFLPVYIKNEDDINSRNKWGQPLIISEFNEFSDLLCLFRTELKVKSFNAIHIDGLINQNVLEITNCDFLLNKTFLIYTNIDVTYINSNHIDIGYNCLIGKHSGNNIIKLYNLDLEPINQDIVKHILTNDEIRTNVVFIGIDSFVRAKFDSDDNVLENYVPNVTLTRNLEVTPDRNIIGIFSGVPGSYRFNGISFNLKNLYNSNTKFAILNKDPVFIFDNFEKVVKQNSFLNNLLIIAYTNDNGSFDPISINTGAFFLFVTYFLYEEIKHLVDLPVCICHDGIDNKQTFLLTNDNFVNPVTNHPEDNPQDNFRFYVNKKDVGIRLLIGLRFDSELELVPLEGGSVFGNSLGCTGYSKLMIVYLYASLGGKYAPSYTDRDNMREFDYNYKPKINEPIPLITTIIKCPLYTASDQTQRKAYIKHTDATNFTIMNIIQDVIISEE